MKKNHYTPLQVLIHLYAWSLIAHIIFQLLTGTASINPVQEMEQRTGRHALTLLILSLVCTPLNSIFGWRELIKRRRTLGLYAFMYATIHIIIFTNIDFGLAWSLLPRTVFDKPYILVGLATFLLLIPLAMTSFDIWKQRLGKRWKLLHQMIYFIAPLALLHFAWSKKGDIFTLQGDIIRPLVYILVFSFFMLLRWTPIKRYLALVWSKTVNARIFNKGSKPETKTPL